ncbi:MAG: UMP kinase [Eubacteriales bacterium]|nr:UMP kinase [Clostridiales bacterium]MDD6933230.1 UMP kinase [Eubacteriales bacterium]MDO4388763.1 UMP kinase [Eubacteriales bacterium]MDY2601587.1 UMP kinase [Eubacteriales bacterium]
MYKRIILKLSGETLAPTPEQLKSGETPSYTFDAQRVDRAAEAILALHDLGVQVGVVMGGGNIWRGRFTEEMNPVNADQMGMLATVINALAVQDAILRAGRKAVVFTAQDMPRFAELYRADKAIAAMEAGAVALLSGGTGNPFFTTDTGAALRAAELKADAVFKGTTVDGVYDSDPRKNPQAKLLKDVSYGQCISMGIKVMDTSAFQICLDQKIPEIRIFRMDDLNNIVRVARGEDVGSRVHA